MPEKLSSKAAKKKVVIYEGVIMDVSTQYGCQRVAQAFI